MPAGFILTVSALMLSGCERDDRQAVPATVAGEKPTGELAPWFSEVTEQSGLDFEHRSGASGRYWLPEITGGGVAVFDADNDGDADLYFVNGNDLLPEAGVAESPVNRLYLQDEQGRFIDATSNSGLGDGSSGMGVAIGDIDNDGDADVYVTNFGPDRLYRNRGDGTFEDITAAAGIDVPGWSCSAAFLDFDRDGYLDLYVTQYLAFDPERSCTNQAGRIDYCGPKAFEPAPDVLLRNHGDGTFSDVSAAAGIAAIRAAGMGLTCEDFNADGWIDIYVANDAYANQLWINQHDGRFVDQALPAGAAYNLHAQAEAGMGVVAADLDKDADLDLFLTHLEGESNTLYRRIDGGLRFVDDTGLFGLASSSMIYTGFGIGAFDIELDGDVDLFIANGRVRRGPAHERSAAAPPLDELAEPNLLYLNEGGDRFALSNEIAISMTELVDVSRAVVPLDLDGDGDLDLVMTSIGGPARVYRNDAPRQGSWLVVRCIDPSLNRDAIGACVEVVAGGARQIRTISRTGSFLAAVEPLAHFGLGNAERIDELVVTWPSGEREVYPGGEAGRVFILRRGEGERE